MEDLIKEEDFAAKPYDPTKVFRRFYYIGSLQFAAFMAAIVFLNDIIDTVVLGAFAILMPVVTGLVMFFWRKEHARLPFAVLASSLFFLFCTYYVPAALMGAIAEGTEGLVAVVLLFFIEYVSCLVLILLLANYLGKREK